jgi:hypothetical protein
MDATIKPAHATEFTNNSIRFLNDSKAEEEEYKGFNPKKTIHALAFMLAGITFLMLLYGIFKVLKFVNKQKKI